jgi:hypothetical protein
MLNDAPFPLPGSAVGRFFPYDCLVAAIAPQHQQAVALALKQAGFTDRTSALVPGDVVAHAHAVFQQQQSADDRFAAKSPSRERDVEDDYVAAARNGATIVIVRTPTTILQGRVGKMLAAHHAASMRFYHRNGIDEL